MGYWEITRESITDSTYQNISCLKLIWMIYCSMFEGNVLTQHWFNGGLASRDVAQHSHNIGSKFCVFD